MARPRRRIGNLPAEATSFVGRRRELAELRKTLAGARLVSLVGPGGVGKTRLGLRAATDLGRGFAGGAWWVELAEVRDPGLVANALVSALDLRDQVGTQPEQVLLSHLREAELLLLLDNCEHVLDASAHIVTEILRTAPKVRVIATSREPLQVPGEYVIPIPPLELPAADEGQPLGQLRQNETVMLFTERAAAASGTFELTASNQWTVVQLCRRLDGLPLAIELAAVRTRVLSVEQILERLTDRFALLTGGSRAALPRQQTLRTTIDWSHDLLGVAEQVLLRRLCAFAGRFTVDDVESVCASDENWKGPTLDTLSALVDKSLVVKEDVGGVACYHLHETMREYASLKLREAAEVELLDEWYVEYYRRRCMETEGQARHQTLAWLQWVELEIENIRSALQKCVAAGDWHRGLEITASIGYYWITRGTTESMRWFETLFALAADSPGVPARAYFFRGWLSMLRIDPVGARPWFDKAIAAARTAGQLPELSEALSTAATAEDMAGDLTAGRRLLAEAETLTPGLDHYGASIGLLQARAIHALFEGNLDLAGATSLEGVRLSREAGDLYYIERMLQNVGVIALTAGDHAQAKATFTEELRIARAIDNRVAQYYLLSLLGGLAGTSGQSRLAAQLLGAAEALGAATGAGMMGASEPLRAQAVELSISALGASKWAAEYETGKRLTRVAALRLALGESGSIEEVDKQTDTGPLAKREAEVAALIADGLTNKEIGQRLFISERTVATHVRNILDKLGFDSRSQVASWMTASAQS